MFNASQSPLAGLPSSALTERLYEIRRQERGLLVEFLEYLAEVERRQVHLEAGFSSLFAFLVEQLGYSKAAAFRRTTAARLLVRFPEIAAYLADGRLCLTTLVELRDVLEGDRVRELLDRASGKTEEQVKELVAAQRPRPAPPDLLRRLPAHAPGPGAAEAPSGLPNVAPAAPQPSRARMEPISAELHTLRITIARDFVADLDAVRAVLSHQIPSGNPAELLHECLRRVLRDDRRRRAVGDSRRATVSRPVDPASRHVAAGIEREVWARDGGRCTFVGTDGHVCGSTFQLQLHHKIAFAKGGPSTAENLTIHCSAHNGFRAIADFGADRIASAVERSRDRRRPAQGQLSLV